MGYRPKPVPRQNKLQLWSSIAGYGSPDCVSIFEWSTRPLLTARIASTSERCHLIGSRLLRLEQR